MVGDTTFDVDGGKANKISTIGVSYGFGIMEDLLQSGPDYYTESVEGLSRILFSCG